MADADIPAVKQEEFLALIRSYDPPQKLVREKDLVAGRYRILVNQPLAELSSTHAKAYAVDEGKPSPTPLYALVYDSNIPIRYKNIQALKGYRHPNMVALIEDGLADISTLSESRYVVVLERPSGQSLDQLLSEGKNPVSESTLLQVIIRPLVDVLVAFAGMGISHNRINLRNIYLGPNGVLMGECVSEPSGFSQDPVFEPIDRALTSSWAKPDYAINSDCYAIAILALHLTLGFKPFAEWTREDLINELLTKGSYHTFAIKWDLSDALQDFFRGLLNDVHRERWDPKVIETWLAGKRFNIIMPSLPKETSRGFDFLEQPYYSRKSLAEAFFRNWAEARALLYDTKLLRWLETALHKPEVSVAISRLLGGAGDNKTERQNNDLLARVIILLDPAGPIRLRNLSVTPDGLGTLLTHAFLTKHNEDVQTIIQILETDLPGFWIEQQKNDAEYTLITTRLQKIRSYARMPAIGFGMERVVYDLNPALPCQSPLIKRFHVTSLKELLLALNMVAVQRASQEDYMDRHIAAFITSKLDISKEISVHELDGAPHLSSKNKFAALKLLVRAQSKSGTSSLGGLCYWIAYGLFPLIDLIHNRSQRRNLQKNLRDAASKGSLSDIADLLLARNVFTNDYREFQKAVATYALQTQRIEDLKNQKNLTRRARIAGRGFAQTIAYTVCVVMLYYTLRPYFH